MAKAILVPTDGSEHASKAVELAGDLAGRDGAALHLLHVLLRELEPEDLRQRLAAAGPDSAVEAALSRAEAATSDPAVPEAVYVMNPQLVRHRVPDDTLESLGRLVLEHAEQAAREKGVARVTASLEDGDPVRCILRTAERVGADMIVMGHRGLSDLEGATFGSVSNKVSHLADCTVVMIK